MSMHNPKMYEKYISFQKRDALYCLEKFGSKLNISKNASVIDLGSGDGFVTENILKKCLPENYKELVGVDISAEMVEYANKKYGNGKISFSIMDLGGVLPKEYKQAFDHAYSNYAIQFVTDQEKLFQNLFDLLKDGGSCLLQFCGRNPLFDAFIALSKRDKWSRYAKNIDTVVIRYHYMKDIEGEVERIMCECGFKDIYVEVSAATYEYDTLEDLIKMVHSGNLFHLPTESLLEEMMEELRQLVWELKIVKKVDDKPEAVMLTYDRVIAFGKKY